MDELLEQMKVRLCEAVDRVIDKVFSDFNTNKLVELKSSEKFHDPEEVDVLSELSDRSIQLNSESKENLPLIQEVDSQNETTESLKIDSRKSKVEPQCSDCNEFWAWHQGFINFSRKLKDVKGNQHMAEMQLRFSGKEYSDTLTTTDPYGFRLLVMERSIASWTAMIGGFTWYNPYEKTPLFLLVVYGEMFHVAKAVLDKNFHPTVIYQAHNKASEDVVAVFDKIAISIDVKGGSTMLETVKSCIGTKFMRQFGDMIDALVIDVVDLVQELLKVDNKRYVKIEQVSLIVTSLFSTMSNSIDESQKLFDEKSQRTVYFCYSTLRTCSKQKQWERTWACFKYLISDEKRENNEADNFTVTIVLKACAGLQLLKQRKILHGFLWKNRKMGLDMFMGSTLIEFYSKGGKMGDAFRVFKEFEKPNVVFWISMMSGYEQNGCFEKVVLLLSRMVVEDGVHLDSVTIISLVHVYATLMNLELVRGIYGIVFYFLGSTKELDKAMDLTKRILILAKHHVWGALLVACKIYHHVEMGELAAKNLLFLDPNHAGVGVAGLVLTVSEEKVIAIKMGDIVAPVFGVCTWWYIELMVIFMSDTSQGHKAGQFTGFFLIGSSDIFTGFTTEFVKIAWDVDDDTIKVLVGKQTGKGIVKLESNVKNADKVVVLDCKNLPLGGEVGLGADIVRMEGNLVCSLGFSCDSSLQVTYTVKTQMSCFSSLLPSFFNQVGQRIHTEAIAVSKLAGMTSDLIGSYTESSYATLIVASISHFGIHPCLITTLIAIDFFEIKTVKEIELLVKRQLAAMYGIAVAILNIVSP